MTLTVEQKKEIITKHARTKVDTGSADVQVALITARINYLQEHFAVNKKDHHSRRGLLKLVGRRRSLLDYIKRQDVIRYRGLIQDLNLRK